MIGNVVSMAMMRSMGFTAVVIVLVEVRRGRVTKERIDFLFVLRERVDEQWSQGRSTYVCWIARTVRHRRGCRWEIHVHGRFVAAAADAAEHRHATMIIAHRVEIAWIVRHRIALRVNAGRETKVGDNRQVTTYARWKHARTEAGVLSVGGHEMIHVFFVRLCEQR